MQASHEGVEQVSNVQVGVPPVWMTVTNMLKRRYHHSATLLPDGNVFLAGGYPNGGTSEIYDTQTGFFTPAANLTEDRSHNTSTFLPDGRLFIVGGCNTTHGDIYEPDTGRVSRTNGELVQPTRANHSATLLNNGKVLLAGGRPCGSNGWGASIDTAELFDPATETFLPTEGKMGVPRSSHRSTLLPNGLVLITGGFTSLEDDSTSCPDFAEIYDPASDSFRETLGSILSVGCGDDANARAPILPSGKVMITRWSRRLELYDPTTDQFSLGGTWESNRSCVAAVPLLDDSVLIVGGCTSGNTAELYDPSTDSVVATADMAVNRDLPSVVLLQNGEVLATGGRENLGDGTWVYHRSAERFVP